MQRPQPATPVIVIAAAILALGASVTVTSPVQADEVQVGRYSTLPALPSEEQSSLLAVMATITFAKGATTVGKALREVLHGSGYRLADLSASAPALGQLLTLPLPRVHHSLGPMHLNDAIQTLVGPAFELVEDPVHRLIGFALCPPGRTSTPGNSTKPTTPARQPSSKKSRSSC
jgi:type IV pili sensor histidine kinase/response regulator